MRFPVGSTIEAHGITPWEDINDDYIILAHSSILELESLNISFYDLRFKDKNLDSVFNTYRSNNLGVYIAKPVTRRPFIRVEVDTDRKEPWNVTEFIYFADENLDMSLTKVLQKRVNLAIDVNIGNFDGARLTNGFKERITKDFINAASNYSDRYLIERFRTEDYLQPIEESIEEDQTFLQIQEQIAAERKAKEDAESARLLALANRENKVRRDEERLGSKEQQLVSYAQDLQIRSENLSDFESELKTINEQLNARSLTLANREYELNQRAKRIIQRENELGIPHEL
jgi:hypothetical protein